MVVISGSGLIGTKLVARLRQQGHDVTAAAGFAYSETRDQDAPPAFFIST